MLMQDLPTLSASQVADMAAFWRATANIAQAISLWFLLDVVRTVKKHGGRLNNHSQRLAKLDQEVERTEE